MEDPLWTITLFGRQAETKSIWQLLVSKVCELLQSPQIDKLFGSPASLPQVLWDLLQPSKNALAQEISVIAFLHLLALLMYAMGRKLLVPPVHALVIDWYDYSVIVVVALGFGLYLLPDFELRGKDLQPRIATITVVDKA